VYVYVHVYTSVYVHVQQHGSAMCGPAEGAHLHTHNTHIPAHTRTHTLETRSTEAPLVGRWEALMPLDPYSNGELCKLQLLVSGAVDLPATLGLFCLLFCFFCKLFQGWAASG